MRDDGRLEHRFTETGGHEVTVATTDPQRRVVHTLAYDWDAFDRPVAKELWWVLVPKTAEDPPMMNLVAFRDPAAKPGEVLDQSRFSSLGVASEAQVGAINWWPSTGQIYQIYVRQDQRRQGIASVLISAAAVYSALLRWPMIWGDGKRTDMGEALVLGADSRLVGNAAKRTHRYGPLDPA